MEKYSKDGPFTEPVVRCDACQKLLTTAKLKKSGSCYYCGNTRVRNVLKISSEEIEALKKTDSGIDPDWYALFEPAPMEVQDGK